MTRLLADVDLLRERPFRLYFAARALSGVGDAMVPVAITFAVLEIGDATDLGFVLGVHWGARVAFLVLGGVWADRLPRQLVLIGSDVLHAATQGFIALAFFTGAIEVWQLALAGALSGLATAFFNPAATGLMPTLVAPERLQEANALISITRSATQIVGPTVSGLVVATLGFGVVFAVDAASFVASFLCIVAIRLPRIAARAERSSVLRDALEGVRVIRERTWLVATLSCDVVANVALACYFVLGPVIFEEHFDGASDWGLMLTAGAIGGLAGSAVALRARPRHPLRVAYLFALVTPMQLIALSPPGPLALLLVGAGLVSSAIVVKNTFWTTMEQQHVPESAISRVDSLGWMISLIVFPAALAAVGPISETIGVTTTLVAVACASAAAHLATVSVRDVRDLRSRGREAAAATPSA